MNTMTEYEELSIRKAIDRAISEDEAHADLTTFACVDEEMRGTAIIILKQDAMIAGLRTLPWVFHALDPHVEIEFHIREGQKVLKGTQLATIRGKARSLLSGERTALNLLQHASAVATMTSLFVTEIQGCSCDILDTRKTLPGLRALQKYAVRVGGGKNHRYSLADRILIKDNHLHLLRTHYEFPIQQAIERAREFKSDAHIEVEVSDLEMLEEALKADAEIILLDNMSIETMKEAVAITGKRAYLEASGGVSLSNVKAIAQTGIQGISIGALTHSAPAIDISMKLATEINNYGSNTQRAYL